MKNPLTILLIAAGLLVTAAFAPIPTTSRVADDTELAKHMKAINTSMRKLRAALKDPKRADEAVGLVLGMQDHALASKALDPMKLEDIEDSGKAEFVLNYRKEMHRWLNQMFEIEIAIMEGRLDDAKALLKTTLKEKAPAHKKFQKKKDK